jgi:hypothetical protein
MSTSSPATSSLLDTLSGAREQVRLSLHLLGADARQKWDELESRILALEGEVGTRAEAVAEKAADKALELSDSVKQFVDSHVRGLKR